MNNIQEKIILNNHIDSLCDLYVKGRFYTVIQIAKKLLLRYKDSVALLNILGMSNAKINKYEDAIINYKKAIELSPDNATTFFHLGILYHDLNKYSEAIKSYKKAILCKPNYIDPLFNLSFIHKELGNYKKAVDLLEKIILINPNYLKAYQCLSEIICQYKFIFPNDINLKILKKTIELNSKPFKDFNVLLFYLNYSHNHTSEEIFSYYQQFNDKFGLPLQQEWQPFTPIKKPKKKLKIGYVSPDFRKHSAQNFLLPTLANHNHQKFEIYAFAELTKEDHVTKQYQSYVDHWIPTQNLTDQQMVQKIRDMEIDILVDLAGHTKNNRLLIFSQKPAPVSITWLGYGYTTGLKAIDYFLTDKAMAPLGSEHLFSEQPWRLSNYSFCCYQAKTAMGDVGPLPALENGHITFGTLTRAIRINDSVIKVWADILKKVKNSKLIINSRIFKNSFTKKEFENRFFKFGIFSDQLLFLYKSPPWDTMRQIDIALDCFPHNSGTTLIEHLYMGNPFITYSNRPSVGKIGASILTSLGHPEWIATSEEEYVEKAVALASDPQKLSTIRQNLRAEMEASPLMDHKGFVRELEEAYQAMWEKLL